jgi:hypothetical protein
MKLKGDIVSCDFAVPIAFLVGVTAGIFACCVIVAYIVSGDDDDTSGKE